MNQAAAKANRKELRRAIGEQAIDDLANIARLVNGHEQRLKTHDMLLSDAHRMIAEKDELITRCEEHLEIHRAYLQSFMTRPLGSRLRWILSGR